MTYFHDKKWPHAAVSAFKERQKSASLHLIYGWYSIKFEWLQQQVDNAFSTSCFLYFRRKDVQR